MIVKGKYTHEASSRRWALPSPPRDDNRFSRTPAMSPMAPNENGEGSRLPTTIKQLQTFSELCPYLLLSEPKSSDTPSDAPKDAAKPRRPFPRPFKSLNAKAGSRLPRTISNCKHHLLALRSPSVVQKIAHSKRRSSTGHATEKTFAENLYDSIVRLEVFQRISN